MDFGREEKGEYYGIRKFSHEITDAERHRKNHYAGFYRAHARGGIFRRNGANRKNKLNFHILWYCFSTAQYLVYISEKMCGNSLDNGGGACYHSINFKALRQLTRRGINRNETAKDLKPFVWAIFIGR